MTDRNEITSENTGPFRVIEGGRAADAPPSVILQLPPPPRPGAAELAADLAEVYALALIRDVPCGALADPHHTVRIDGATRFTLHELLCELRSLTWFDDDFPAAQDTSPDRAALGSRAAPGDAGRRRALRRNGDGQLTLRSLFRGAVGSCRGRPGLSAFHAADFLGRDSGECGQPPAADAPMSHWIDWVGRSTGAALQLPGRSGGSSPGIETPRVLVERLKDSHPCRIYYSAALSLLARGTPFDQGLQCATSGDGQMTSQAALALMSGTAERAFSAAMSRQAHPDRLSRPGVLAARLTAMLARDEGTSGGSGLDEIAEDLSRNAPGLLHWVARANRARGRHMVRGSERMLLLPMESGEALPHRSDATAQVLIAGALTTLLKAMFDTRHGARLHMVGSDPQNTIDIVAEADRLAADVALARTVSGSHFHAENHQELRLGEAIALHSLRTWMETAGRSAQVQFTDLDGRIVQIAAHSQGQERAHVTLRIAGRHAPWPLERGQSAHLAVV